MRTTSRESHDVIVDGRAIRMGCAVREAFELGGRLIVLFDANAYLQSSEHGKSRRRGEDVPCNLQAFSLTGDPLWEAEFPGAADYYYKVVDRHPLTALSFSSFRCVIDAATGRIVRKEFCK